MSAVQVQAAVVSLAPITFHVQDPAGAPIAGAILGATSPNGNWQGQRTNLAGDFTGYLSAGHYDVTIEAAGFQKRLYPMELEKPGTINIGLERAVSDLEAHGKWFYMKGVRTPLFGIDGFMWLRQFIDGVNLQPFVDEANEVGARVVRVFCQGAKSQNQVMDLDPREPAFYGSVRPFAEYVNGKGLIPLMTIGIDNQVVGMGMEHWARMGELIRPTMSLWSAFNEWSKNHGAIDPLQVADPGMLWSRGSDQANGVPLQPPGSFMEFHGVRDWPTAMRDAVASPVELYDVQGLPTIPLFFDEPVKMGTNGSGPQWADPEVAYRYFTHLSSEVAGAIFHNWFGQRGLLMDAGTKASCQAAQRGFTSL